MKYWVFVKQSIITNIQQKIMYYVILGAPLFSSLLSPLWLLPAMPYAAFSFLSTYTPYYSLGLQYTMYVVPQLFVAHVMGINRIKQFKRYVKYVLTSSLIISILLFILYNPLSPIASQNLYVFIWHLNSVRVKTINSIIKLIPNNASVLTTNSIFPHIANRIDAYVFPMSIPNYNGYVLNMNVTYILMSISSRGSMAGLLKAEAQGYGLLAAADGFYLFEKNYYGKPIMYEPVINYTIPAGEFQLWSETFTEAINYAQAQYIIGQGVTPGLSGLGRFT